MNMFEKGWESLLGFFCLAWCSNNKTPKLLTTDNSKPDHLKLELGSYKLVGPQCLSFRRKAFCQRRTHTHDTHAPATMNEIDLSRNAVGHVTCERQLAMQGCNNN